MVKSASCHKKFAWSQPAGSQTLFGLFRHGKTLWNMQKKIQGSCDSPLTEEGKQQVALWTKTLRPFQWNRILASDLGRVKETVSILVRELQLPFSFDSRLREQDWGEWEEKTLEDIRNSDPQALERQISSGWQFRAPGGESRMEVLHRSRQALFDAAGTWPAEKILVVSHRGVISCLLYHLAGRKFLPTEKKLLQKDRLHTLLFERDELHLATLNIAKLPPS